MNKEEENTIVKFNDKKTINLEQFEEMKPDEKRKSPFLYDLAYNCKTTICIKNAQHEVITETEVEPGKDRDSLGNYITRLIIKGSIAGRGYYIESESEDKKFNKIFFYQLK